MCENGAEYADVVDPRVQIELETLNNATDEINRLEGDLDIARSAFRNLLCDSTAKVDALRLKLGLCVERAKPYYEARICASESYKQTQIAAAKYEKANSAHSAAREMVFLAEQGLGGRTLDPAWQEMLNHATQRVNESEHDRSVAAAEHRVACVKHEASNAKVKLLQKELKRAIAKSRPYYELKAHCNKLLEYQRARINNLETHVSESKCTYAEALRNLEQISDEIHRKRSAKGKLAVGNGKQMSLDSNESYVDFDEEYKSLPFPLNDCPPSPCVNPEMEGYKLFPSNTALSPASSVSQTDGKVMSVDVHSGEWTEINLDVSSPEEEQHYSAERAPGRSALQRQKTLPNPEREDAEFKSVKANKTRLDSASITNWINRSSAVRQTEETRTIFCGLQFEPSSFTGKHVPGRRQSLDNILGPTSEKMKEIWSQGMMMLNISERRGSLSSDAKCTSTTTTKKLPSPLEKTLTYLNVEDDTSDCESLSSIDMLNEEQIISLMLDKEIHEVCEQVLGTSINEVVSLKVPPPAADSAETASQQ